MDLKRRIEEFKEMEYEFNKDFYATIKEQQHPHTLFIACSDSRVDAETLFQAHAGEIFRSETSQISYREKRSLILTLPSSLPSSTPLSFSALKT